MDNGGDQTLRDVAASRLEEPATRAGAVGVLAVKSAIHRRGVGGGGEKDNERAIDVRAVDS